MQNINNKKLSKAMATLYISRERDPQSGATFDYQYCRTRRKWRRRRCLRFREWKLPPNLARILQVLLTDTRTASEHSSLRLI